MTSKQYKRRSPQEIATEILATIIEDGKVPVSIADELAERKEDITQIQSSARLGMDMETPLMIATRAAGQLIRLHDTLQKIKGGTTQLDDKEKKILKNSGNLVRLLINEQIDLAGEKQDDASLGNPLINRMRKTISDGMEDIHPGYAKELKKKIGKPDGGELEAARTFTEAANILRETVTPLLEELAGSLHLPFNKPRGIA